MKSGDWDPKWIDKEDVWFESGDGTRLFGWFVSHPKPRHVILYSHGNNEHVGNQVNTLLRLQSTLDATVLVYDYRGYGKSEGKPTEEGLIADGLAAQQWLSERTGLPLSEILLMGRSLGGCVSVAMAVKQPCKALLLDATSSSMVDAASYNYPWLPVKTVMRDRFDSVARVKDYAGPIFQSHRTTDEVVPVAQAQRVTENAAGKLKQFFEVPHGRHNEPLPPNYYTALGNFLDRVTEMQRERPSRGEYPGRSEAADVAHDLKPSDSDIDQRLRHLA